jgi:KDO2-lipid IV(A) lauroyltransferase
LWKGRFINEYRRCKGAEVIEKGSPRILKILREGGILELAADQNAGRGGIMIDFLGYPASTHRGPALLALKTGAPLLVSILLRENHLKHRLIIKPPIDIKKTGEVERDILINTEKWLMVEST